MKKFKIFVLSIGLFLFALTAILLVNNAYSPKDPLLKENMKALATSHYCPICGAADCICDGVTTWNCSSGLSKCSAVCGTCQTEVNGTGKLTGSHSCN